MRILSTHRTEKNFMHILYFCAACFRRYSIDYSMLTIGFAFLSLSPFSWHTPRWHLCPPKQISYSMENAYLQCTSHFSTLLHISLDNFQAFANIQKEGRGKQKQKSNAKWNGKRSKMLKCTQTTECIPFIYWRVLTWMNSFRRFFPPVVIAVRCCFSAIFVFVCISARTLR